MGQVLLKDQTDEKQTDYKKSQPRWDQGKNRKNN